VSHKPSVHFCRLRKQHADPTVTLNGKHIPVVEETKFLGLVFDRKLTFVPHLRYLRTNCLKALDFLRVVAQRHGEVINKHCYTSIEVSSG